MLTGRLPFKGTNALAVIHAVLTATPAPIRTLRPDVAPELEEVVEPHAGARSRRGAQSAPREVRDLAASCLARLSSGRAAAVARRRRRAARGLAPRSSPALSPRAASRGGPSETRRCAGHESRRCRRSSGSRAPTVRRRVSSRAAGAAVHPGRSHARRAATGDLARRRQSSRIRPARRSSTVHTGAAASRGGRSAARRSTRTAPARPAALEGGDGRARDGRRRGAGPVRPTRRTSHFRSSPQDQAPAGMVRIASPDRAVQLFIRGARSSAGGQPAGLLDRSARGHEPRVQAVCGRRRIPPRRAVARAVS